MRVSGIYCEGRPIHKRGNGERKGERERETTTVTLDRFNAQSTVGEDHMGLERDLLFGERSRNAKLLDSLSFYMVATECGEITGRGICRH